LAYLAAEQLDSVMDMEEVRNILNFFFAVFVVFAVQNTKNKSTPFISIL
jgi:hypothetical protein